jgi:hypothetical protein
MQATSRNSVIQEILRKERIAIVFIVANTSTDAPNRRGSGQLQSARLKNWRQKLRAAWVHCCLRTSLR